MRTTALIDDMGAANVGFFIENIGKDAGELQYLRELIQNGIESISRAGRKEGRIEVDFEEIEGVKKLRITDNGIGMTPDGVRENINHLSASSGIQAFDKNFGIGAKITAAVRNPYGVMYKAWKDPEGSLTILGRQDGRYGRMGFRKAADDTVDYWLPLWLKAIGTPVSIRVECRSYCWANPKRRIQQLHRRVPTFHRNGWPLIWSAAISKSRPA
jgi:hypothetical protein